MLVYAHRSARLALRPFLRGFTRRLDALPAVPRHDRLVHLLVDFAEADAAIADAVMPEVDDDLDRLAPWRSAARHLSAALAASWWRDGAAVSGALDCLRAAVAEIEAGDWPPVVDARPAEGFACYGLYPEQYLEAAAAFTDAVRPASLLCVGIRSIGSALAPVVAASAARRGIRADVRTVRPRGHPFDRRLRVTARLTATIASWSTGHVAIVDEGPGLSGSSFAAAADAVLDAGVPRDRIVLFPGWTPAADRLGSDRGRATWRRFDKAIAPFEAVWLDPGRLLGDPSPMDLSAGRWRSLALGDPSGWPAVQPQHERRKYLSAAGRVLHKFAGLGRHGLEKHRRASRLAEHGVGPPAGTLAHGFLSRRWLDGVPLAGVSGPALDTIGDYVAVLRRECATDEPESVDELHAMMTVNFGEAGDADARRAADALAAGAGGWQEPRVAVDGRMLPHEWIACGGRLLKTDALDHHADDFFPGCRDAVWDLAGAIVELDLDEEAAGRLLARYADRSGDRSAAARLPFHVLAYLAWRLGYTTLAADTLGDTDEGRRFRRDAARYRRSAAARAARPPRPVRRR